MANLFQVSKIGFHLVLLSICFTYFGWPSLQKYLAKNVSVRESTEAYKHLKPPAITLCAQPPGWKGAEASGMEGHFKRECQDVTDAEGLKVCVENRTFSFDELIVGAVHGIDDRKNLSKDHWTWDMFLPAAGRCFTLRYNQSLANNFKRDGILILLNPNVSYIGFFHELDFFTLINNPLALPMKRFEIIKSTDDIKKNTILYTMQVCIMHIFI